MDLSNQNLNYTDALEIASNNYKKAFGNSNVVKIPDEIILNKGKINLKCTLTLVYLPKIFRLT